MSEVSIAAPKVSMFLPLLGNSLGNRENHLFVIVFLECVCRNVFEIMLRKMRLFSNHKMILEIQYYVDNKKI